MPTGTLDDLKLIWKALDEKLERQHALALHQWTENKRAHLRSGFRLLIAGQIILIIVGAVTAFFSAQFWLHHLQAIPLAICGLFLHAYGIMMIIFAARDLDLIRRIDYAAPVLEIQKRLVALRLWHLRAATWHGYAGSVVWLPVILLALHAMGGDFWIDNPQKLLWLVLSAGVCLAVNYALIRLAHSPGKCGLALRASFVGRSVNRAQERLDEIGRFEEG